MTTINTKSIFSYDYTSIIKYIKSMINKYNLSGEITVKSDENTTTWFDKKARPIKIRTSDGYNFYYIYTENGTASVVVNNIGSIYQYDETKKLLYVHNKVHEIDLWYHPNGKLGRYRTNKSDTYWDENGNLIV